MAYLLYIQLQIAGLSASKFSCLFKLVTSAPPPEMQKGMVIVSGKGHFLARGPPKARHFVHFCWRMLLQWVFCIVVVCFNKMVFVTKAVDKAFNVSVILISSVSVPES